MIKIVLCFAEEIAADVFAVNAKVPAGHWFQHNGPVDADFFTEDQANALVRKVLAAGEINATHWTDGRGGYFSTEDHQMALVELEYWERAV